MQKPLFLTAQNGDQLAYHKAKAQKKSSIPNIIFLGGLMSDMNGTKAVALEAFCKGQDYNFIRFDYMGHGESSGKFEDGTISRWKANALEIIDNLTEGKTLLIGSSLGGWIMLLAALERPEKIAALIGIASAPDFTEELMWEQFDESVRQQIIEQGIYHMPSEYGDCPYPVTKALIEDGRKNLLLQNTINLHCPVRLLHGMKDDDVPYSISVRIAEQLSTQDVEVTLIKSGDHRMSDDYTIKILCKTLQETLAILQ